MTTPQTTPELLACPFCSRPVPEDLSDTLYPSGIYRRYDAKQNFHHYVSMNQSQAGDEPCWQMNCTQNTGGCGASISGDSRKEVIAKWNARAGVTAAPLEGVPSDVGFKIVSAWLQQEGRAANGDQLYTMCRFADFVLSQAPQPPASVQPLAVGVEEKISSLMQLAEDYADEAINHGLYAPATYEARDRLKEALAQGGLK